MCNRLTICRPSAKPKGYTLFLQNCCTRGRRLSIVGATVKTIKPPEERFFENVSIMESGCWEWEAYCNQWGYGQFGVNAKLMLSHRFSWEFFNGKIPDGLCVLHKCDNPPCCNPTHLFLGTRNDNTQDMIRKGRKRNCAPENHGCKTHPEKILRGEQKPAAKLKASDVLAIRKMISEKVPHRKIAKIFGVSAPRISYIKNRKEWAHIP